MGVLEMVKKGFSVAMSSKPLLLVLFGFGFIWNLINLPLQNQVRDANLGASFSIIGLSLVFVFISIFIQAGTLGFIRDMIKGGQCNLTQFKEYGMKYYLRVLAIGLIVFLVVLVLVFISALLILILAAIPDIIKVVMATVFVIAGIVGIIFLFFAPYAAVVDDSGVFDSLKSSIVVVKAYFWKVFLTGLLLMLAVIVIGFVLGLVTGLLSGILGFMGPVLNVFVSSVLNAFFSVVFTGTFMSFYLNSKLSSGGGPGEVSSPS